MDEVTRPTVSLEVAQHVLWWFGDTNLGLQPGTFSDRLMNAASAADTENLEKLELAFPEMVFAWRCASREHWGIEWLRSKVKRSLMPDRELVPVDLFEAAAAGQVQS